MSLILYNLGWMSWNIFLAFISIALGYLSVNIKSKSLKGIFIIFFLLFIPNTIYIVSDLAHLIQRWYFVENWVRAIISLQYLIFIPLGFLTFLSSLKLLEKSLIELDKRLKNMWIMVLMNFLISFGVVIGRVQRANSWHVITKPQLIVENIVRTLSSTELMIYVLLLGFFCNLLYYGVKKAGVGERT